MNNSLPQASALVQAEILALELEWNGGRRSGHVPKRQTGEGQPDVVLNLLRRRDLHQLKRLLNHIVTLL